MSATAPAMPPFPPTPATMNADSVEPKSQETSGPAERRHGWVGRLVGSPGLRPAPAKSAAADGAHARLHWPAPPGVPVDDLPALPRHFLEMDEDA